MVNVLSVIDYKSLGREVFRIIINKNKGGILSINKKKILNLLKGDEDKYNIVRSLRGYPLSLFYLGFKDEAVKNGFKILRTERKSKNKFIFLRESE